MDASLALLLTGAISGSVAIISPIILSVLNDRSRRKERLIDFARQDEIAHRLLEANQKVADNAHDARGEVNSQLRQIHTLVNSDMTAARQSELDQTRISLVLLRKIAAMDKANGHEPTEDEVIAIQATEKRIARLEQILSDRMSQMKTLEAEREREIKLNST